MTNYVLTIAIRASNIELKIRDQCEFTSSLSTNIFLLEKRTAVVILHVQKCTHLLFPSQTLDKPSQ